MSRLEAGARVLVALAKALGVTVDELLRDPAPTMPREGD
jgi:hypothetical protein